jgi:two-component system chemotaxis response regulator CheY
MTTVEVLNTNTQVTILVVDDEPDMRLLARAVLEAHGISVVAEAANGHEAVTRLRDLDPPPIPTVVLLDNRMPGPTGLEVAAQLLAETPDQLIVLFSAYLTDEDERVAAELGVARCLSKKQVVELPQIIIDLVRKRT